MILNFILLLLTHCFLYSANDGDISRAYYLINPLDVEIVINDAQVESKQNSDDLQRHLGDLRGSFVTNEETFIDGRVTQFTFTIEDQTYTASIPQDIKDGTQLFFNKIGDTYKLKTLQGVSQQYDIALQKASTGQTKAQGIDIELPSLDIHPFEIPEMSFKPLEGGPVTDQKHAKDKTQAPSSDGSQPAQEPSGASADDTSQPQDLQTLSQKPPKKAHVKHPKASAKKPPSLPSTTSSQ